jgi:hypothetical protein
MIYFQTIANAYNYLEIFLNLIGPKPTQDPTQTPFKSDPNTSSILARSASQLNLILHTHAD